MKEAIIVLDSNSSFELEDALKQRYNLGLICNSSNLGIRLEQGAYEDGSISCNEASMTFRYIIEEKGEKVIARIYPKMKRKAHNER